MTPYRGWHRGHVCNYHDRPNGPIVRYGCVLMEDPIYVPAWGGVFVMLDCVDGVVPFRQISAPRSGSVTYRQCSLIPDLVLAGLTLRPNHPE